MTSKKKISVDPWLHDPANRGPVSDDAVRACIHSLDVGIDEVRESVYFRRTDGIDELWVEGSVGPASQLPD